MLHPVASNAGPAHIFVVSLYVEEVFGSELFCVHTKQLFPQVAVTGENWAD